MVEYVDGSVLAQMGNPDMRIPLRMVCPGLNVLILAFASLDLAEVARLDFEPLDHDRFPCLGLAANAIAAGGTMPVALNAANEVAVDAFLNRRLPFTDIYQLVNDVCSATTVFRRLC